MFLDCNRSASLRSSYDAAYASVAGSICPASPETILPAMPGSEATAPLMSAVYVELIIWNAPAALLPDPAPTFWQFDSIAQVAASAVVLTPMALAAASACEPQS